METNIFYQLAKTECALERCEAKLFKKNLTIVGLIGVICLFGKVSLAEAEKYIEAKHKRDEIAEERDKVLAELNELKKAEAKKSACCDGHVKMTDVYEKLKKD